MKATALIAWIGLTDLKASRGELRDGVGPVAQAAMQRDYGEVHLLSDHSPQESKSFVTWLQQKAGIKAKIWPSKLSGPTRFGEIYEAATYVLRALNADGKSRQYAFHVSPGTPAMGAVWIILAKTQYPAELLESSPQEGLRTVSLPFEISADYLPPQHLERDEEIQRLTQGLPPEVPEFGAIIHRCQAMKTIVAQARRVAVEDVAVLIQGESGTGKELFARAIHASSRRADGPFIEVNCGAIPAELVESEFFGVTKGAYTGASEAKPGYIESSDGGTLFLDEIGELPLAAQVKLLRVLQEKRVRRLGGQKLMAVNFRVIAATNRSLLDEVGAGRFREDLFHRLAIGVLNLPPLRERKGDLALLIDHFLERLNDERKEQPGWSHKKISAGARNLMNQHPWKGNVRELSNTLCRAAIWSSGAMIETEQMRTALFPVSQDKSGGDTILNRNLGNDLDLRELVAEVARHYLSRAFEESHGNKSEACRLVGLPSYQTFANWMKKYKLKS